MYHAADSTAICGIMTFLIAEALKGQNSPYVKNALLISLFNLLIQKSSGAEEIKESEKGETAVKILEYLQEHYTTVTLTDAAKYFNYSVPYLSKLIQDLTGDSFIKILQRIKLKEACHLLATTDCRISEIPALVGYDNAVYFNRIFKQKIGTSPYRYRKIHKNTLINGPYTEGSLL